MLSQQRSSPGLAGSELTRERGGDDVEEVTVQEDKSRPAALSWMHAHIMVIISVYKVQLNKSFSSCVFTSLLSELYRNILLGHFHESFD